MMVITISRSGFSDFIILWMMCLYMNCRTELLLIVKLAFAVLSFINCILMPNYKKMLQNFFNIAIKCVHVHVLTCILYTMDQISTKKQNPKCRLYWCLIEFWRHSQSCWYFQPLL
jgi:hypothetical protein